MSRQACLALPLGPAHGAEPYGQALARWLPSSLPPASFNHPPTLQPWNPPPLSGVLNKLFAREASSRRRGLYLRTYAVLPLTEDCGILQWVNNLVPFKACCEEIYTAEGLYKRRWVGGWVGGGLPLLLWVPLLLLCCCHQLLPPAAAGGRPCGGMAGPGACHIRAVLCRCRKNSMQAAFLHTPLQALSEACCTSASQTCAPPKALPSTADHTRLPTRHMPHSPPPPPPPPPPPRRESPTLIKRQYDNFQGTRRGDLLDKVMAGLPPRMHRWLLQRFADPAAWLAARLGFTRTNAVWCMVGHVLGLGDRWGRCWGRGRAGCGCAMCDVSWLCVSAQVTGSLLGCVL